MNAKDMLDAIFQFRTDTPIPAWEFGYWCDTLHRWYGEGLPKIHPPERGNAGGAQFLSADVCAYNSSFSGEVINDVSAFFGLTERIHAVPINSAMVPAFDQLVLSEDAENITYRRGDGKTVKARRDGSSMPMFMEYPVRPESARRDFEAFAARFDADAPERYIAPIEDYIKFYENRSFPLQLGGGNYCGFYSVLRECLGVEETAYLLYDDPELVDEMLTFFTDFYIRLFTGFAQHVQVDYFLIWEDMCFKNGPLISPSIFRSVFLPHYKRFIGEMKKHGVSRFMLDTDGNCELLIPDFLDAGVTAIYPFEVAAGMDIEDIRAKFPELVIIGGIDKRALAAGPAEIDAVVRKAARMLEKGGYLPCVDHAVSPDVSFSNYCYFRQEMQKIIK